MRDIVYFCNTENLPGCVINLDWSKAFDKVNIDFLCKILSKMGFSNLFINIILIFYADRNSKCLRGASEEYHLRQFYLRSLQSISKENIILKYLMIFRNRFVDEHFCLRPLNSGQNGP